MGILPLYIYGCASLLSHPLYSSLNYKLATFSENILSPLLLSLITY